MDISDNKRSQDLEAVVRSLNPGDVLAVPTWQDEDTGEWHAGSTGDGAGRTTQMRFMCVLQRYGEFLLVTALYDSVIDIKPYADDWVVWSPIDHVLVSIMHRAYAEWCCEDLGIVPIQLYNLVKEYEKTPKMTSSFAHASSKRAFYEMVNSASLDKLD